VIGSGVVLGVACDLKSTAWLAVPVLAAMFAARDGVRAAWRFVAVSAVTAVVLIAALARPRGLAARRRRPGAEQRAVPARPHPVQDPGREACCPARAHHDGHGRARDLGRPAPPAGLGIAISLVISRRATSPRRPGGSRRAGADVPARAQRPFGYFIYPLGLIAGWP